MFAPKDALFTGIPPIVLDGVGPSTTGALTNPGWNHPLKPSRVFKTLLVVGLGTVSNTPSAVTCGGTALTRIGTTQAFSTGILSLWYLLTNAFNGSTAIAITNASSYTGAGSVSYRNVRALSINAGGANVSGTALTETLWGATPAANTLSVAAWASANSAGSFTVGTGFNSRFNDPFTSNVNYPFLLEDKLNPGQTTVTATNPGSSAAWIGAGFTQ